MVEDLSDLKVTSFSGDSLDLKVTSLAGRSLAGGADDSVDEVELEAKDKSEDSWHKWGFFLAGGLETLLESPGIDLEGDLVLFGVAVWMHLVSFEAGDQSEDELEPLDLGVDGGTLAVCSMGVGAIGTVDS